MRKQAFVLVIFILLLVSTVIAQKNKSSKNEPQPSPSPQISLEQRLGELSKDISDELTDKQKTTIAVAEFVDLNGNSSDFGKFLAEELVTRLYKTKKLKVIERQRLDKVIAEQKLSLTDMIEASSAKRIGRILGVDAIVAGTISELGNNFRINARIINTETGELIAAAGATIAKDQEVCSLINCVLKTTVTNTISQPIPTPQSTPIVKPITKTWKAESNLFTFELQKCTLSGTSAICELTITNNSSDRNLGLYSYKSKMFDEFNNESTGKRGYLANKEGTQVSHFLVSGIPTKAKIIFEGISSDATKITLLDLVCGQNGYFHVQYRNVPLR